RRWWRRTARRGRRHIEPTSRVPRRVRGPPITPWYWDLVTLRVHALHVRRVVATLELPRSILTVFRARRRPAEKPDSRANGSSGPRISSSGTHRGPGGGTERGTDDS